MIPLRLKAAAVGASAPFVARLNRLMPSSPTACDLLLTDNSDGALKFSTPCGDIALWLDHEDADDVDGDVVLIYPARAVAHRLIRARSQHNTLLVTEQCDQLCVMCSQPPRPEHEDLFGYFRVACRLAPLSAVIGLTGGEPTLHKAALFAFMSEVLADRPDLSFHVLSNAQHLDHNDRTVLTRLSRDVLWGIPIYASDGATHDRIVGKRGAFPRLLASLSRLARAGASVELRTVVTAQNYDQLPKLAEFITTHIPFAVRWAIMQLERFGYARKNWDELFVDSSRRFDAIAEAIAIASLQGVEPVLFNFPLCTVPEPWRTFAAATVSDWKRHYPSECGNCSARERCGGFFAWSGQSTVFAGMRPI